MHPNATSQWTAVQWRMISPQLWGFQKLPENHPNPNCPNWNGSSPTIPNHQNRQWNCPRFCQWHTKAIQIKSFKLALPFNLWWDQHWGLPIVLGCCNPELSQLTHPWAPSCLESSFDASPFCETNPQNLANAASAWQKHVQGHAAQNPSGITGAWNPITRVKGFVPRSSPKMTRQVQGPVTLASSSHSNKGSADVLNCSPVGPEFLVLPGPFLSSSHWLLPHRLAHEFTGTLFLPFQSARPVQPVVVFGATTQSAMQDWCLCHCFANLHIACRSHCDNLKTAQSHTNTHQHKSGPTWTAQSFQCNNDPTSFWPFHWQSTHQGALVARVPLQHCKGGTVVVFLNVLPLPFHPATLSPWQCQQCFFSFECCLCPWFCCCAFWIQTGHNTLHGHWVECWALLPLPILPLKQLRPKTGNNHCNAMPARVCWTSPQSVPNPLSFLGLLSAPAIDCSCMDWLMNSLTLCFCCFRVLGQFSQLQSCPRSLCAFNKMNLIDDFSQKSLVWSIWWPQQRHQCCQGDWMMISLQSALLESNVLVETHTANSTKPWTKSPNLTKSGTKSTQSSSNSQELAMSFLPNFSINMKVGLSLCCTDTMTKCGHIDLSASCMCAWCGGPPRPQPDHQRSIGIRSSQKQQCQERFCWIGNQNIIRFWNITCFEWGWSNARRLQMDDMPLCLWCKVWWTPWDWASHRNAHDWSTHWRCVFWSSRCRDCETGVLLGKTEWVNDAPTGCILSLLVWKIQRKMLITTDDEFPRHMKGKRLTIAQALCSLKISCARFQKHGSEKLKSVPNWGNSKFSIAHNTSGTVSMTLSFIHDSLFEKSECSPMHQQFSDHLELAWWRPLDEWICCLFVCFNFLNIERSTNTMSKWWCLMAMCFVLRMIVSLGAKIWALMLFWDIRHGHQWIMSWQQIPHGGWQCNTFCFKSTDGDQSLWFWDLHQWKVPPDKETSCSWFCTQWIFVVFSAMKACKICISAAVQLWILVRFHNWTFVFSCLWVSQNLFDSLTMTFLGIVSESSMPVHHKKTPGQRFGFRWKNIPTVLTQSWLSSKWRTFLSPPTQVDLQELVLFHWLWSVISVVLSTFSMSGHGTNGCVWSQRWCFCPSGHPDNWQLHALRGLGPHMPLMQRFCIEPPRANCLARTHCMRGTHSWLCAPHAEEWPSWAGSVHCRPLSHHSGHWFWDAVASSGETHSVHAPAIRPSCMEGSAWWPHQEAVRTQDWWTCLKLEVALLSKWSSWHSIEPSLSESELSRCTGAPSQNECPKKQQLCLHQSTQMQHPSDHAWVCPDCVFLCQGSRHHPWGPSLILGDDKSELGCLKRGECCRRNSGFLCWTVQLEATGVVASTLKQCTDSQGCWFCLKSMALTSLIMKDGSCCVDQRQSTLMMTMLSFSVQLNIKNSFPKHTHLNDCWMSVTTDHQEHSQKLKKHFQWRNHHTQCGTELRFWTPQDCTLKQQKRVMNGTWVHVDSLSCFGVPFGWFGMILEFGFWHASGTTPNIEFGQFTRIMCCFSEHVSHWQTSSCLWWIIADVDSEINCTRPRLTACWVRPAPCSMKHHTSWHFHDCACPSFRKCILMMGLDSTESNDLEAVSQIFLRNSQQWKSHCHCDDESWWHSNLTSFFWICVQPWWLHWQWNFSEIQYEHILHNDLKKWNLPHLSHMMEDSIWQAWVCLAWDYETQPKKLLVQHTQNEEKEVNEENSKLSNKAEENDREDMNNEFAWNGDHILLENVDSETPRTIDIECKHRHSTWLEILSNNDQWGEFAKAMSDLPQWLRITGRTHQTFWSGKKPTKMKPKPCTTKHRHRRTFFQQFWTCFAFWWTSNLLHDETSKLCLRTGFVPKHPNKFDFELKSLGEIIHEEASEKKFKFPRFPCAWQGAKSKMCQLAIWVHWNNWWQLVHSRSQKSRWHPWLCALGGSWQTTKTNRKSNISQMRRMWHHISFGHWCQFLMLLAPVLLFKVQDWNSDWCLVLHQNVQHHSQINSKKMWFTWQSSKTFWMTNGSLLLRILSFST